MARAAKVQAVAKVEPTGSVTIPARVIRGLLAVAANQDVRYFLNGIFVDIERRALVATNGHIIAVVKGSFSDDISGPSYIVDRVPLTVALRGCAARADIVITPKTLSFGQPFEIAHKPIDGTYPAWHKIIPRKCSGVSAQYKSRYIAALAKVICLNDRLFDDLPKVVMNGMEPALVLSARNPDAFGVIMPWRDDAANTNDFVEALRKSLPPEPQEPMKP